MGRWVKGCSSLGEACQLSRIRNCWEMFERRRRRRRGRGWSIVSSEERKGTGLCPPAPAPPPAGAKFSEGGKERVGSSSGLVHVGESLPPGLPASPQAPPLPPPPPPLPTLPHPISGNSAPSKGGCQEAQRRRQQSHTEMSFSHELEFNPKHTRFVPRASLVFSWIRKLTNVKIYIKLSMVTPQPRGVRDAKERRTIPGEIQDCLFLNHTIRQYCH